MIRKIMIVMFSLMLTVSMVWLGEIARQENVSSGDNEEAARIAMAQTCDLAVDLPGIDNTQERELQPNMLDQLVGYTDPEIEELLLMDIEALRDVNNDVIGWIRIPDTNIDYPLLYGEDNEHYLKHSWKNESSDVGAIFMEHENSENLMDFNTIIYGHNMRSGSMFGSLKEYRSRDFWEKHPCIYILHEEGVFRYDIFAAYRVGLGNITYAMQISNPKQRAEFIRYALENSQLDTGIQPDAGDRIITLSTCTDDPDYRWVVQGVLNDEQSYYKKIVAD